MLTLSKLARLPVIPVFRKAKLFTAHVDDLVAALETLMDLPTVPSIALGLAHETPTPFPSVMRTLAAEVGSTSTTLPVPWHPLWLTLRVAESVGVPLPVRSDSLLGLVRGPQSVPQSAIASELGLEFRPFPDGLAGSFEAV